MHGRLRVGKDGWKKTGPVDLRGVVRRVVYGQYLGVPIKVGKANEKWATVVTIREAVWRIVYGQSPVVRIKGWKVRTDAKPAGTRAECEAHRL